MTIESILLLALLFLNVFSILFIGAIYIGNTSRLESITNKITTIINLLDLVTEHNKQLENAARANLDASGALLDVVKNQIQKNNASPMMYRQGQTLFSTQDGKITAKNIDEFIDKLEQSDDYKHVAEDLRRQLENELDDDDDDENDAEPFKK
jgi:hypothetical protein